MQSPRQWATRLKGSAGGSGNVPTSGANNTVLTRTGTGPNDFDWKPGGPFINVLRYGAVGNNSTDNSAAIQAALNVAATYSAGATVYFPPRHTDGTKAIYKYGTTLTVNNTASIKLLSEGSWNNSGGAELQWTGTGAGSAFTFGSSRGFEAEGIAFTYSNNSFTGTLLNGRIVDGQSDTSYSSFKNCWFGSTYPTNYTGADLVMIDGSHNMNFENCKWFGGKRQLIGKLAQGITSAGGFAIHVVIDGCSFAGGPSTMAIYNPDESWYVNAVCEPLASGAAGFISHGAGIKARGLTVEGAWCGDVSTLGGKYITFSGEGLSIIGGTYSNHSTIVYCDENNVKGVMITGVAMPNMGSAPVIEYAAGTTGHTGVSIVGADLSNFGLAEAILRPPANSIIQCSDKIVFGDVTIQDSTQTYPKFKADKDGILYFGSGTAALDIAVYRLSAGLLYANAALAISGGMEVRGDYLNVGTNASSGGTIVMNQASNSAGSGVGFYFQTAGVNKWVTYMPSGQSGSTSYYIRDQVNSRFQVEYQAGNGNTAANTNLFSNVNVAGNTGFGGEVALNAVGASFKVKEGTNAISGIATLVAGTVVVNTTKVTANSRIYLTNNVGGGTVGFLRVSARTAGASFTILSSSNTDTSQIAWLIVEPA